ncbi:MAG: restriction endonuclease subunit S, partial [Candidatus Margulisiibacteriota bacterium]
MTAAIDITTEQRKTLLALLRRFIPGVAVWAYGSRVKWAARPNSDLDLVAFTSPAQRHLVSELKDAIGESNLPFLVDLHVWDEVPERFYEIIRKEYIVLQETEEERPGGAMAGEWATTRLGQVAAINPDAIGRDWPFAHIRYIDISSVKEGQIEVSPQWMKVSDAPSRAKRLVRKGDTVLSTVRPNRRSMFFVSQPGEDWVVSTGFAVLRPKTPFIDPRFLYACVFDQAFTEYLITREKGAAYPAVSPEDIANAELSIPPLKEQQAIGSILGTLDDKIELNRRMNETLEAMARAIFKSWFVDFDPVRGLGPHNEWQDSPVG